MSELREKPPVLSERQFEDWCALHQKQVWDRFEVQRDADVAWFREEIEKLKPLSDDEMIERLYGIKPDNLPEPLSDFLPPKAQIIAQAIIDDTKRQLFEKLEGR